MFEFVLELPFNEGFKKLGMDFFFEHVEFGRDGGDSEFKDAKDWFVLEISEEKYDGSEVRSL